MRTEQEITASVESALEQIRPFLQADGGDIRLLTIEGKTVKVELQGSCSKCSMSQMTMRAGVEESIRKTAPEVEEVIAINMPNPEEATPYGM